MSADGPAWLFCPADRPERYAKAAARADVVVLDLEDGVAARDRVAARRALIDQPLDPSRTVVRISPVGTEDNVLDLNALAATAYQQVMLAKTEAGADASAVGGRTVIALCETPLGVLNAPDIARAEHVQALMWGAEDLTAALGGRSSRFADRRYRDFARHARSTVLLAAAAAGRSAIDSVYLDIADLDGLALEAADAVESGFVAKACIHPSQVDVVRRAFRPSVVEVERARRILAAAVAERGVFTFDGQMVDEPVLRQARRTVSFGSDPS